MKAALCESPGGPVVVREVPEPRRAPDEVLVDVHVAAVNFSDLLIIRGDYQVKAEPPFVPGSEFAGVVAEPGHGFQQGERVFGSVFVGAFAERVSARPAALSRIPPGVPMRRAAAFGVAHFTAFNALHLVASVRPGERVAVLGACAGPATGRPRRARRPVRRGTDSPVRPRGAPARRRAGGPATGPRHDREGPGGDRPGRVIVLARALVRPCG